MLNKLLLIAILLINIAILVLLYATNPNVISDAFGSGGDDSGLASKKAEPSAPSGNDSATVMGSQPEENTAALAPSEKAPEASPADADKAPEQKADTSGLADKPGQDGPRPADAKLAADKPEQGNAGLAANAPASSSNLENKPASTLYEEFPGFFDSRSALSHRKAALD